MRRSARLTVVTAVTLFTWRPGDASPVAYAYDRPVEGMLVW